MNPQTSLFDPIEPITRVTQPRAGKHHRNASPTELKAALKVAPKSGTSRFRVLLAIVEKGRERGLIDWEVASLARIPLSSVTGRRNELMEGGFVENSGKEDRGPYGADCTLWIATERGRRAIENARKGQAT